jgi:hypothetical protein
MQFFISAYILKQIKNRTPYSNKEQECPACPGVAVSVIPVVDSLVVEVVVASSGSHTRAPFSTILPGTVSCLSIFLNLHTRSAVNIS